MCWIHFAMRDPGTVYAPGGTDCGGWSAWAAGGGGIAKSDGSSSSSSGRGSSASGKGGGGGSRGPVAAVVDMVAGLLYGNIGYVSSPSPVVPDGADRALQSDAMERHADRAAGTGKSSKSVAGDGGIENAGGETSAPSEGGKAVSWHDGGEPALAHMPSPLPGQPDEPPMHQQHMSVGAARPSEKLAWHPLETFRRCRPCALSPDLFMPFSVALGPSRSTCKRFAARLGSRSCVRITTATVVRPAARRMARWGGSSATRSR